VEKLLDNYVIKDWTGFEVSHDEVGDLQAAGAEIFTAINHG
jgi:hypothetical protein